MALDINQLEGAMIAAARRLGTSIWTNMEKFALPELKKIAVQIVSIEQNKVDFTEDGARILLDMQIRASITVIVAMTTLTMLAVQTAINQILAAIKTMANAAIGFPLI